MVKIREATLTSMFGIVYEILNKTIARPVCKRGAPWEQSCRTMIFGSFASSLIAGGLYPVRRPAAESPMSIKGLLDHAGSTVDHQPKS
jgi:hypothetical protein